MTTDIMNDWFYNYFLPEVKAHYGNRKIILTLDNASSHPKDLGVSESQVDVQYLPANTTAIIQPMDHGAIYTMMYHYLYLQYGKFLKYITEHKNDKDPLKTFFKNYTFLDAIRDIYEVNVYCSYHINSTFYQ